MDYVLFGQMDDPNIAALRPHFDLFLDQASDYTWDINTNTLVCNDERVKMRGFFGRANVFTKNTHQRFNNWHLMANYLDANSHVSRYNRRYNHGTPIKASNLRRAMAAAMRLPTSVASSCRLFQRDWNGASSRTEATRPRSDGARS